MIIDLLLALAPGQNNLLGVDDDDIVTAINVRREDRKVLAPQTQGND